MPTPQPQPHRLLDEEERALQPRRRGAGDDALDLRRRERLAVVGRGAVEHRAARAGAEERSPERLNCKIGGRAASAGVRDDVDDQRTWAELRASWPRRRNRQETATGRLSRSEPTGEALGTNTLSY